MAKVDVYRLAGSVLVVDLQTDLIGINASRIVTPLGEVGRSAACPGLLPQVEFDEENWIIRVPECAAVPGSELRNHVGSSVLHRDALRGALEILIDGI